MKNYLLKNIVRGLAAASIGSAAHAALELNLVNTFTFTDGAKQGGIEIVGYTPDDFTVAGIYVSDTDGTGGTIPTTFGVQILTLGATGSLTERFQIDLNAANTGLAGLLGVTSTALDPLGRNFGVATVIPTDSTGVLGKLAYFNYETGAVIGTIDVGFHPDNVSFSADGTKIYVANEGEFKSGAAQAAGSISIIDVSSITAGNLASLTTTTAATFDFSPGNLGGGVSLSGIRNSNVAGVGTTGNFIASVPDFTLAANQDAGAIEPEYITVRGGKAYVTLQDNNAIGVFNLTTQLWEKINNLGTITQTIDATDNAGDGAQINDVVKGLPMPDTIASYVSGGKTYLVTANEGDARVDDRDVSRFGATSGTADMDGPNGNDGILDPTVYPTSNTGIRSNPELGRLNISRLDGDNGANGGIAGDGKIDDITMIGTRSYTIWEVQPDGSLLMKYDSGSLEPLLLGLDPAAHNISAGNLTLTDSRSDDKGPEPEGLSVFEIDGSTYLALALERQNGLLLFDITDPSAPSYLDYSNTYFGGLTDRLVSPEGMFFIAAADSPTGFDMLLVGYEGFAGPSGAGAIIAEGGIGVYQVVPEPGSAMLMMAGVGALLAARRRKR